MTRHLYVKDTGNLSSSTPTPAHVTSLKLFNYSASERMRSVWVSVDLTMPLTFSWCNTFYGFLEILPSSGLETRPLAEWPKET